ncbi:MAG: hypothetical protein C5B54_02705 [Acidobacteria bacterium]|nr:MAG: hypothetical protein C5B54_02705 [Acidobacteriota bacterium]
MATRTLQNKTFLVVLCLIICSQLAFAHYIVLKSGKRIEGDIVQEDATTVHVKQPDGVIITLKKDQLDLSATFMENETAAREQAQTKQSTQTEKNLKQTQTKKAGSTQTFTNEDVKKMPEISVLGTSDSASAEGKQHGNLKTSNQQSHGENIWRAQAKKLHEKRLAAEEYCKRRYRTTERQETNESSFDPNCPAIVEVNKQIDELKERARKAQIPDQWIADVVSD